MSRIKKSLDSKMTGWRKKQIMEKITRSRGKGYVPTTDEIKKMRGSLTQSQASALIYTTQVRWSDYENGKSRMHPAVWELFTIKRKNDIL